MTVQTPDDAKQQLRQDCETLERLLRSQQEQNAALERRLRTQAEHVANLQADNVRLQKQLDYMKRSAACGVTAAPSVPIDLEDAQAWQAAAQYAVERLGALLRRYGQQPVAEMPPPGNLPGESTLSPEMAQVADDLKHPERWVQGAATSEVTEEVVKQQAHCLVPWCGHKVVTKSVCATHYNRLRSHGDPYVKRGVKGGGWMREVGPEQFEPCDGPRPTP